MSLMMSSLPAPRLDRRRVLFIGAVFAGAAVTASLNADAVQSLAIRRWSGQALGAHATIQLAGAPAEVADAAFDAVTREIARLEAIFSLYDAQSEISRLNRDGELREPHGDFLEVLGVARTAWQETGGLFDPTVQPLFDLYARHFTTPGADPNGPGAAALKAALVRVGFERVSFDEDAIRLSQPGMAMTLNGIAQGYITDKVAALLRASGFSNMLLDVGEIRALGLGRSGHGWRVGIEGVAEPIVLSDQAVATSRPLGTVLDPAGKFGHIFDPRRGFVATPFEQVTMIAESAARADALSTAAVLMTPEQLAGLQGRRLRAVALPMRD